MKTKNIVLPKVALITGGTRGLGAEMAKSLLQDGWVVFVTYKNSDAAAQSFKNKNHGFEKNLFIERCSLSDRDAISNLKNKIIDKFGYLDSLINNAGINKRETIWDITEATWNMVLDTNLKDQFFFTREFWDLIKKSEYRRIIFISSVAGQYHGPKTLHYSVSKAGLISMTKVLARYGAPDDIYVNSIAPGLIETDQNREEFLSGAADEIINSTTLLKRPGTLADVSSALRFLLDKEQNYFTGQTLAVSGGAIL